MDSTEVGVSGNEEGPVLAEEKRGSDRAARPGKRSGKRPAGADADEGLWDVPAVAAYLNLPVSSIYKMTARRATVRIPHIRLGNTLRFRRSDIDRWLTILTVSNLATLTRMGSRVSKVIHGNDSQTKA
jgi:excisionase family DNA binding protein